MGKLFSVSDIYLAAYLTLSGLALSLEKKGRKVLFCFETSPELYKKLQEFNEGNQVDVSEFSRELRRLRALMYEHRG